jgi:DNA-binding CsgD family transcriptional regulator
VLIGRDAEQRRIAQLLEGARQGRSGVLVLRGEAGVGKTALIELAVESAVGFRVLSASGVETEAELAFAGLQQLLRPVIHVAGALPARQARALRTALASESGPRPERLAVSAAALGLLALEAEDSPVLCVIDDAHWLDHASAQTLFFVARRLGAERIAMLFAAREPERARFLASEMPTLQVEGLAPTAARTLLGACAPDLAEGVAARLVRLTRGNPLALLELPRALAPAQLASLSPLDDPLRVRAEIEQSFLNRARALSPDARHVLVLVAAEGADDDDAVSNALETAGLAGRPLTEARTAGLLAAEALRFCHPLARSAVYHLARPVERRAAHSALARATTGPDRRAWHLAAATEGTDEGVAAELELAADAARRRGGAAAEAKTLLRAAELTADAERRAQRLLRGAFAAEAAGWVDHAEAVLRDVVATTADAELRSRAVSRRSYLLADRGEFERAYAVALDEAERASPAEAAHILAGGAFMAVSHSLDIPAALAMSERAWRLSGPAAEADLDLREMVSRIYVLAGRVAEASSLARSGITEVDADSVLAVDFATDLLYLEDYPRALETLERVVSRARAADASGTLSYALDQLAKLQTRIGHLTRAYANELAALELAEARVARAASLAWLSYIEAQLGRPEAGAHAREALGIAEEIHDEFNIVRARAALGAEALAHADAAGAADWLEPAVEKLVEGGVGLPNFFRLDGDLIEALIRLGRDDDARTHLRRLAGEAEATRSPWALGTAARSRGLLAADHMIDEAFEEALALHRHEPSPLEWARTELCYGERLRRARRRRDARPHLRGALVRFEHIEARPWADRARGELNATGEHVARSDATTAERLTPQEFQVATLVADGLTNRETAARLYLSQKTIEFHLGRVYRKLDVRTRGELIRLFSTNSHDFTSQG